MPRGREHNVQGKAESGGWAPDVHQHQRIRRKPVKYVLRRNLSSRPPNFLLDGSWWILLDLMTYWSKKRKKKKRFW